MLLLLSLIANASAATVPLAYNEALDRALAGNLELQMVAQDLRVAEGALLAARGIFDPNLTAYDTFNSQRNQDVQQFGEISSDLRFNTWGLGLGWFAPTGTTASLDWRSTRSEVQYDLIDFPASLRDQFVQPDPFVRTRLGATLTQNVLQGHQIAFNLSGVRRGHQAVDAAQAQLLAQRQQTLANVALAYWASYYQGQLVEIARQALAVSQEEARVVRVKVEQGTLAPVEQTRADAAVVQAERTLIEAQQGVRTANDSLALALGEEPGTDFLLSTAPAEAVALNIDVERAVAAALENNPSIVALKVQVVGSEADWLAARHQRLPTLDATGSFALNGTEADQAASVGELFSGQLPEWSIGANLSVPLGNRADRGNLNSAAATYQKMRLQQLSLERTISQQVRAQAAALQTAAVQVQLSKANLRLAEQTLAAERALLDAGRSLQKDVLASIRGVDTAKAELQKASADYQVAIIELERLKGNL